MLLWRKRSAFCETAAIIISVSPQDAQLHHIMSECTICEYQNLTEIELGFICSEEKICRLTDYYHPVLFQTTFLAMGWVFCVLSLTGTIYSAMIAFMSGGCTYSKLKKQESTLQFTCQFALSIVAGKFITSLLVRHCLGSRQLFTSNLWLKHWASWPVTWLIVVFHR